MPDAEPNSGEKPKLSNFESLKPTREMIAELSALKTDVELSKVMEELGSILRHPQHPLYLIPAGATLKQAKALKELLDANDEVNGILFEFQVAHGDFTDVSKLSAEKKKLITEVAKKILLEVKAYEVKAQEHALKILEALITDKSYDKYREEVAEALGLGGNPSGFTVILKDMAAPLPEPKPTNPQNWTPEAIAQLRTTYEDMRRDQHILVDSVFNLSILNQELRHLHPTIYTESKMTSEQKVNALKTIGSYLGRRLLYSRRLGLKKEKDHNGFLLALTASSTELAEEFLEEKFGGGRGHLLKADKWIKGKLGGAVNAAKARATIQIPKFLERMPPDLRARILQGYAGAQKMAGGAMPPLSKVAGIISRSPMGYPFWRRIFAMNNPITGILMLVYVNRSQDKLKAAMTFATYMVGSAGMGALMETVGAGVHRKLVWRGWFRRAALRARMSGIRGSSTLARMMRMGPKHPALQFAIIMAVAIGGSKYIDQFTTWIDEDVTSDSPEKEALKEGVNFLSGGSIVEGVGFIGTEVVAPGLGLTNLVLDPEKDALRYLGSSQLTIRFGRQHGTAPWRPTMQRENLNRFVDWNSQVQKAMEQHWNPLQRKLFALERAGPGAWTDRQAFSLYGLVEHAKGLQTAIAKEMVERKQIQSESSFNLLGWAIDDKTEMQNSKAIPYMEDHDAVTMKIRGYIKGIKASDESDKRLKAMWKDYRMYVDEIARRVEVYRHLGVYNRGEWLGKNARRLEMTDKVQRGIAEELKYLRTRDEALLYRGEGRKIRGEFSVNLSSLTKTQMRKTDVSDVIFSSLFTKDGTIVDMRSHFYKRALIAAAEAAGLALPKEHDINALFAEMRRSILNRKIVSIKDVIRIRDRFTDAVREHSISQKGNEYRRASKSLTSGMPYVSPGRVFLSRSIDQDAITDFKANRMPDNWPDIMLQKVYGDILKKEIQKKRAHIVLFQQVIPEWGSASKFKLAIHTMTCVECPGEDPSKWMVHIHRHQTARDILNFRNDVETSGDKGNTSSIPYPIWVLQHPDQANQIEFATLDMSKHWSKTPAGERKRKVEAAQAKASTTTDEFVKIPYSGEHHRKYGDAVIVSRGPGGPPWFPNDPVTDRRPLRNGEDFEFTVKRPGKEDEVIKITDRDIRAIKRMPAAKRTMVIDVLTTPFEDASATDDVARVLNVFHRNKYSPSNFNYHIRGIKEEYFYETLHDALVPLYKKADNKKYFLERLFTELDWRKDTISKSSANFLSKWFANNMELFDSKTTAKELRWFDAGDRILGYSNINGVYIINKDPADATSALQYAFFPGWGWQWRPDPNSPNNPDPRTWHSPNTINIRWRVEGRVRKSSPTSPNVALIRKLQPYCYK